MKEKRKFPSLAQLKHLPRFLSKKERVIGLTALLLAVCSGGILGYRYILSHRVLAPAVGGNYTEGLVGYPSLINPLYASVSDVDNDLTHLVYSGLVRFDPKQGVIPDLADHYELSEDGKTYTFTLKDGLSFHNGDPVTSADVAFTFHAIQNPEYSSPLQGSFEGIGIDTPDEKTVIFTLSESFAPFLSYLTVGILPSEVWGNVPPASAKLAQRNLKPIGSGPYQFEKLTKDSNGMLRSMVLTRNKHFYREGPYIETLTFKFYGGISELGNLLRNRNIQGAVTVPFEEITRFDNDHAFNVLRPVLPQYTAAFFNLKSDGVTSDDNVKKALTLGADRQTLITTLFSGRANALTGPLFSGTPGGTAPEDIPGPDKEGAISALETSGWKIPEEGGTRQKGEKTLSFTLTYANSAELSAVAEELKKQWEEIGFSVTLNPLDAQSLQEDVLKKRNYEVLLAGELYGIFRDPYPYWHSSQGSFPGLNISQLTNRAIDQAISTIRTTPDEEKRAGAYGDFAKAIADEQPAVFLYQRTYAYVLPNIIKNVDLPTVNLPADRFANVNEWYMKQKLVLGNK